MSKRFRVIGLALVILGAGLPTQLQVEASGSVSGGLRIAVEPGFTIWRLTLRERTLNPDGSLVRDPPVLWVLDGKGNPAVIDYGTTPPGFSVTEGPLPLRDGEAYELMVYPLPGKEMRIAAQLNFETLPGGQIVVCGHRDVERCPRWNEIDRAVDRDWARRIREHGHP